MKRTPLRAAATAAAALLLVPLAAPGATAADVLTATGTGTYYGATPYGIVPTSGGYTFGDAHGNETRYLDGDPGRSFPGYQFVSADGSFGAGYGEPEAVDTQVSVEATHRFFLDTYGRNGIWGTGRGVTARVQPGLPTSSWNSSLGAINVGEGFGHGPLSSVDLVAHEWVTGLVEQTANLGTDREAGAIRSSLGDIFGTLVEFSAALPGDPGDYTVGELVNTRGDGTPMRYLDQPSRDGHSFDCWSPTFADLDPTAGAPVVDTVSASGPMNHAFYLLAEGSGPATVNGTSYDSPTCNGGQVDGIGRGAAGRIVYAALTSPTATQVTSYAGWRDELVRAARTLYGTSSTECTSTVAVMDAVSVPAGTETCAGTSTPTTSTTSPAPSQGITELTNGVGAPVPADGTQYHSYSITVPEGAANLVARSTGGDGYDVIYLRYGSMPTTTSWECTTSTGSALAPMFGSYGACTVAAPKAGTYYILVESWEASTDSTLVATFDAPGSTATSTSASTSTTSSTPLPGTALRSGDPVTIAGKKGSDAYWTVTVPEGASRLVVSLAGGSGDADLYVKALAQATRASYDCRPFQSGNAETCTFDAPQPGDYSILVHATKAYKRVTLKASWS